MSEPVVYEAPTLSALLRRLARERGSIEALVYPAFVHGGRRLSRTYGDLDARVDALAAGLYGLGVRPGERVALWAQNLPDWVPLEFALARLSAVLVTVNTALQRDEVAYVLRQSRSATVLHGTRAGSNECSLILDGLLADGALPGVVRRAWMAATPDEPAPEGIDPASRERGRLPSIDEWVERGVAEIGGGRSTAIGSGSVRAALAAIETAIRPGDLVNIQYTSGTTGFPKGVLLSHANLLASGRAVTGVIGPRNDDRIVLMVPLFHCFGCVVAVLGAAIHGATLCCLPSFDPGHALRLIHEERCTLIHGVPTMYSAMLAHPDLLRFDTTSLRCGVAAGAPCPRPLMQAIIERLHCPGISVAYGLTEASPGVSGSDPGDSLDVRCGSIGRALPHVEVAIFDPATGRALPDGEQGEIRVRGPNIMLGYNDDPEATARAITPDGWLCTGDLGKRDRDGVLHVVGRIKDIIIRGGENIAPAEIESVLREHPDVVDAAVFAVPDDYFGEEVAAALILRPGKALDPATFTALLRGRVASFKIPKVWRQLERFPLTGSGKVQKFRLREMLVER